MTESTREQWRAIPGYEGHYEVSDRGRVRSLKWGQRNILKASPNGNGYNSVGLTRDRKSKTLVVHRLVMHAFVGPRPDGLEVRHLDGNQRNNRLDNLAYGTHAENMADSARLGATWNARKTHCKHGHEFSNENTRIDALNKRVCRTCAREGSRRRRQLAA